MGQLTRDQPHRSLQHPPHHHHLSSISLPFLQSYAALLAGIMLTL